MMKKKFELKTSKVKGISFHKTRHNWIGIGLFTGEIQIWDFRNGFKVANFKESDSCIRTIDFHPIQSIIIGGGDDHTIRGYDYSQNKKIFELKNHVDFIRTVQFHSELPWILSASDDQTIRIWNWQSKSQIAVITGHGHYIMCAKFHPSKDLIVSGSLDSTLRIWDFSKLKSKFSKSHGTLYMFSNDVEPIIITEAHMKGVNWVDFHPTEKLVATCSDDKLIKLWDYTGSNAYEKQVLHGHTNNVSCLAFSNCGKFLLSNGEDFVLRIWDLSNGTTLDKIEIGEQRQWVLAVHGKLPLVAVGCDESLNIVSLFPEKIFYEKKNNFLVYYSNVNNSIQLCDIITNTNKVFNFDRNDDGEKRFCKYLTVNNFGKNIDYIDGFYKLKDNLKFFSIRLKDLTSYSKTLQAKEAVFISSGEFVTLESGNLNLYQINKFALQESLDVEENIEQIFPALFNHILYRTKKNLVLYNVKEKKEIFSLADNDFGSIKKLIWNPKKTYFAVLNKRGIYIINKKGKIQVQNKIDSKVKSMIWEKNDKIIFNTHEHIDYLLINGESGIIRSIDKIIFLIKIQNKQIIFFDVNEDFEELDIDLSEIEFKTALMNKDLETVKKMLKETEFLGKSIVSYLLKKKYDSITLQLTNDKETSFYLALHAGKLETAFNIARELDNKEKYRILADKATNSGALGLAELCLNLSDQKDKLITHFVITGNKKELNNLQFSDVTLKFNKTLFTGNIKERIKILAETGQVALAYATAKIHGIQEYEEALLNVIPDLDSKIKMKGNSELLLPPKPLVGDMDVSKKIMESWPLFDVDEEIQNDKLEDLSEDEEDENAVNNINEKLYKKIIGKMKAKKKSFTVLEKTEEINDLEDDGETGNWGDDIDDLDISDDSMDSEFKEQVMREEVAWKHFMIGDKKGGKNLLESQIGYIDNQSPLDDMIGKLEAEYEQKQSLKNPFDITYIKTRYKLLLSLATKGKLKECLDQIKNLMISLSVSNLKNNEEIEFVEELKKKLLNYFIAFRAKMLNDKQKDLDKKAELCLVIALTTLEPSHSILILSIVINNLFKLKCYEYASYVVKKYLKIIEENNLKPEGLKKMMKVLKVCEKRGSNKIMVENIKENDLYDEDSINRVNFEDISLCNSKNLEKCNFDGSRYLKNRKDDTCILCNICRIGFKGDGLKYI